MADLSNKKAFAGSGVLAALGVIAGGALGKGGSIIAGVILGSVSSIVLIWLLFRGPEEVEVRFADEDSLGIMDKFFIRRTINNCCVYLRGLGLSPSPVSPVLGMGSLPIALTPGSTFSVSVDLGTACICSGSSAPDTAGFTYQRPWRKTSIASAYIGCWLFRLLGGKVGGEKLCEFQGEARFILELYFCYAFCDAPFTAAGKSGRWVDALLTVRNTCGEHFTDTVVAYTLQLLSTAKYAEEESFDEWLCKSLSAAILNTVSRSSQKKANRAISILNDYGMIPKPKQPQ